MQRRKNIMKRTNQQRFLAIPSKVQNEMDNWFKMLRYLQAEDGKPVHLKRAGDKALMYITFAGCGVGLVSIAQLFYQLS